MPRLTIIVPIYNVASYLHQCINSILAQTYIDWELLLIDDGSTDQSGEICDEYAKKDNRIRVFHKENGGVSSARNLGIDNANGEWITFIDSDDYILPSFIEGLFKPINEWPMVDFVQGGCLNVTNGKIVSVNQSYEPFVGDEPGTVFRMFRGLTVSKLFRLENVNNWIDGHQLRFDVQMKIAEDMAFTIDYLLTVKRYAFVDEVGYCYRNDNMESATNKSHHIQYETELHSFKHLYKSTISYVVKNNLGIDNCTLRFQQRGNQMLETIFSLYASNINKKERLLHLHNDFSTKERELLRFADIHPLKKFLIGLLANNQDNMFDILASLIFQLRLCLK